MNVASGKYLADCDHPAPGIAQYYISLNNKDYLVGQLATRHLAAGHKVVPVLSKVAPANMQFCHLSSEQPHMTSLLVVQSSIASSQVASSRELVPYLNKHDTRVALKM